jgi:predicted nuclease with TOPRIM domain
MSDKNYIEALIAENKSLKAEKEKLIKTIEDKTTRIWQMKGWLEKKDEAIAAIEGEVKKLRVKTSDIEDSEDVGWNEAVDEVLAIISKFKEGK